MSGHSVVRQEGIATNDPSASDSDLVLTPGGRRPRGQAHPVPPGQAVRRGADGTLTLVPSGVGSHDDEASFEEIERGQTMPEEQVLTPGGYRPASVVHQVEPGHFLRMVDDRIFQFDEAGTQVAAHDTVSRKPVDRSLMPGNVSLRPVEGDAARGPAPALAGGWIAYAGWTNNAPQPLSSFEARWSVPPAPATASGQTIFLFNGIQNSTMIYQPVLQWGQSAAGGGNNWTVASWYVDGKGGRPSGALCSRSMWGTPSGDG